MNEIKKGNILIVDDEIMILTYLSKLLEKYVDKIFTATTANDGLEILKNETIYCVISDIIMPEKNGVEFIKEVRDQKFDIPFIFFTGHGNQHLLQESVKYGAFDFLNKPDFEDLEEIVQRALQKGLGIEEDLHYDDFLNDYHKILSVDDE